MNQGLLPIPPEPRRRTMIEKIGFLIGMGLFIGIMVWLARRAGGK
jgi:hypothetical protein